MEVADLALGVATTRPNQPLTARTDEGLGGEGADVHPAIGVAAEHRRLDVTAELQADSSFQDLLVGVEDLLDRLFETVFDLVGGLAHGELAQGREIGLGEEIFEGALGFVRSVDDTPFQAMEQGALVVALKEKSNFVPLAALVFHDSFPIW